MTDQANIATELDAAGVPHDAMRRLAELEPGRPGCSSSRRCMASCGTPAALSSVAMFA